MKKMIRGYSKVMVSTALAGATLQGIGTNMTGNVKGIGDATQSMVAVGHMGYVGHALGVPGMGGRRKRRKR